MKTRPRLLLILFVALAVVMCSWVLSLPEFPSQDGPMHFYYAHVLGSLLQHDFFYSSYFYIRTLFPPYAIHYYLLILLTHVASNVMAEKLLVCIIFVVLSFGFRFLALACGPTGSIASLFIFPLLLNWPLGMGFFNFLLSLGFGMWALGFWWRTRRYRSSKCASAAYVALVLLMTITHPVPVLIVLSIAGVDLALRLLARPGPVGQSLRLSCGAFLASSLSIFYILHFTDRQRVEQSVSGPASSHLITLVRFIKLSPLAMFAGSVWSTYLYRLALYAILLCAVAVALSALRKTGSPRSIFLKQNPWLLIAAAAPIVLSIIPSDMNGSHFFSDRLLIIVWLAALLAASAHPRLERKLQMAAVGAAVMLTVAVLLMAESRIRPIARVLAAQRANPFASVPGSSGILLGTPITAQQETEVDGVSFNPYIFSPAYAFADTSTVMLNSPWLDLPILPLATRSTMLNRVFSPAVLDSPHGTLIELEHSSYTERQSVIAKSRFLIFANSDDQQQLTELVPGLKEWRCEQWLSGAICLSPLQLTRTTH